MFKIRKKIFPSKGYEICEKKYFEFLEKRKKYIDDTLLKMFRHDYFHDGNLLDFHYNFENSLIKLQLRCPNFISPKSEYVNVDFYLNFYDVDFFQISSKVTPPVLSNAVFLYGELGTLACSDKKISLIMEFISPPHRGNFFISIICRMIEVEPKERLAFKLLLDSNQIALEE